MGLALTYLYHGADKARSLVQNCIGCDSCKNVCSAGIDLPRITREIRSRLIKDEEDRGITEDELKTVIQIPAFQQMYRDELAGFRSQGSKAASLYRTGTLSQALMEHLFSDAMAGHMKAPDMLKLLELLLKASGQLNPEAPTVNVQTNVGVAIPVPDLKNHKLDHLKAVEAHG